MDDELLRTDHGDGIRWLTINRPSRGNSLSADVRTALQRELDRVEDDLAVRVVVLAATGTRHFCTGADLRAPRPEQHVPDGGPARVMGNVVRGLERPEGAQRLVTSVMDSRVPVIAAVNGMAAGLGAQLALACDLVVAVTGATFAQVATRRGILPDAGAAYLLPRLVGMQRAKELLLLADDLPAERAHEIGLVNRLVAPEQLETTTMELATRLASGPTLTLGLVKRLVNSSFESDRATAFRAEALSEEIVMASEDGQEGLRSFVERRPLHFHGW